MLGTQECFNKVISIKNIQVLRFIFRDTPERNASGLLGKLYNDIYDNGKTFGSNSGYVWDLHGLILHKSFCLNVFISIRFHI